MLDASKPCSLAIRLYDTHTQRRPFPLTCITTTTKPTPSMLFVARSIGCRSFTPPEFPLSGRGFETSTGDIEAVILQQACANWTQSSLHIGVERHINVAHVGEPAK